MGIFGSRCASTRWRERVDDMKNDPELRFFLRTRCLWRSQRQDAHSARLSNILSDSLIQCNTKSTGCARNYGQCIRGRVDKGHVFVLLLKWKIPQEI